MFAQSNGIIGHVFNENTKEVIAAATITIGGVDIVSNYKGAFVYDLLPGVYQVGFSKVGFDEQIHSIEVVSGEYKEINISLLPSYNLLEQTAISDSKNETKVTDSPVSINIITAELIENNHTTDVSTIINKTTGVQVVDGQVSIREGAGWSYGAGSRVIVLIDGLPSLQTDAHRPNWTDIPVEIIDQIEVIKGASSVLYGSSALNGIINVRTKGATLKPQTKFVFNYNHFMNVHSTRSNYQWWGKDTGFSAPSEINISGVHRVKKNQLEIVLNGFYSKFKDYYKRDIASLDAGHMEDERFRIGSSFKYKLSDRITFKLGGLLTLNSNESPIIWKSPQNALESFEGAFLKGENVRFNIDPLIQILDRSGNEHTFQARFYFIDNKNNNNQSNKSINSYGEYQFQRKFYKIGMVLNSGFYSSFTRSNAELYGDEKVIERNLAWYSQFEKDILNKWRFIAGLRVENYMQNSLQFEANGSESETKAIGRVGIIFDASKISIFRISWGQGYRFPSIAERFVETNVVSFQIKQNPGIMSESGWSSEIGLKQGWSIPGMQGYIDIAGFWSQFDNMIEFQQTRSGPDKGSYQSRNVGDTDIKGIELNIAGTSNFGDFPLNFLAGYTFSDPQYSNFQEILDKSLSTGENVLKYRSKHNLKADIGIGYKNLKLGVSLTKISHVINVDNNFESRAGIGIFRDTYNNGYTTIDGRISYDINTNRTPENLSTKISIVCKNLTNEIYAQRIGILNPPRSISAQIQLSF